MSDKAKRLKAFRDRLNKNAKKDIAILSGGIPEVRRFSTGSFEMDVATGGGWPFNRMALCYGRESSGKTTTWLRACNSIVDYCHHCKTKYPCVCGNFAEGTALVVETEGSLDVKWAAANGLDEDAHLVVWPDTGEDAINIIDTAIRENEFDLIVLDSIQTTVPSLEIEKGAEDCQPGIHARMMNKGFRKWSQALVSTPGIGPLLLCTNQVRDKIGVLFGDPTTLPGGNGQRYMPAIHVRLSPSKVHDSAGHTTSAYVEIKGTVIKNKTYIPRLEYNFHLSLQNHVITKDGKNYAEYVAGEINNAEALIKHGRQLSFIKCGKGDWYFELPEIGEIRAKGKACLLRTLQENDDAYDMLYEILLKARLV